MACFHGSIPYLSSCPDPAFNNRMLTASICRLQMQVRAALQRMVEKRQQNLVHRLDAIATVYLPGAEQLRQCRGEERKVGKVQMA